MAVILMLLLWTIIPTLRIWLSTNPIHASSTFYDGQFCRQKHVNSLGSPVSSIKDEPKSERTTLQDTILKANPVKVPTMLSKISDKSWFDGYIITSITFLKEIKLDHFIPDKFGHIEKPVGKSEESFVTHTFKFCCNITAYPDKFRTS